MISYENTPDYAPEEPEDPPEPDPADDPATDDEPPEDPPSELDEFREIVARETIAASKAIE